MRRTVAFVLPDLGAGGAQKVMLSVAGALDPVRYASRILVVGGSQALLSQVPAGLDLENGRARRLRNGIPWLVGRLRALKPETVVSVMGYLNLALLGLTPILPRKMRVIVREANAISATQRTLSGILPGRSLYRLYARADCVVCPTQAIATDITHLVPRARNIAVVRNPVDVERLRAQVPKRCAGPGLRLVSAGRLTEQKGYDRLLPLLTSLPRDTHLTIFGDGPDRARLEAQAKALGLAAMVTFAGFSWEVAAWSAGADAFVLPSRWEGLPNVVLESLAVGTPVIVSDQAAVCDLAREAPAGAVAIRPVDQFDLAIAQIDAMSQCPPAPRPSLLPAAYLREAVAREWIRILDNLVTH